MKVIVVTTIQKDRARKRNVARYRRAHIVVVHVYIRYMEVVVEKVTGVLARVCSAREENIGYLSTQTASTSKRALKLRCAIYM